MNNVIYIRYAETARINWAYNIALHLDPGHKREWMGMCTPLGDGMILKSIKTDYKFVRATSPLIELVLLQSLIQRIAHGMA